jgi:hypothetical protein
MMSKSSDNLELGVLYMETISNDSHIINEMTEDVIDYLNDNFEKLPFDSIFGDKLRIVIPMGGDITAKSIINDLKRIKNFSGFDLHKGEVIRKIQIDSKYGGGDKEQKINIGKAVSGLKIDPETKKKYLDWLARYKDNLEDALNDQSEYGIIISRAPIDVVRMSDHRNISSCHSRGGSHFYCAVKEAITGGAVSYLVHQETIDDLESDDELQNPEFFWDNDRSVEGFRPPIARLRIRRLESESGKELGVPDDRVYGDSSIPGFHKTLVDFLKRQQSGQIKDYIDNPETWVSRGGSYFDTKLPKLAEDFIENGEEDIDHDEDDRSTEAHYQTYQTQGWEDELSSTKDQYNRQMDHCKVYYYVDDNGEQPYIFPSGSCSIDLSQFNLPEDIHFSIADSYQFKRAINGDQDDEIVWSGLFNYFKKYVDIGTFEINSNYNTLEITFDSESQSVFYHPSEYDEYCESIRNFDSMLYNIIEDPDELEQVFKEIGLISDGVDQKMSRFKDYQENGPNYKSFTLHEQNAKVYIRYPENFTQVSSSSKLPRSLNFDIINYGYIELTEFIVNIGKQLFKPINEGRSNQNKFFKLYENYINSMAGVDFRLTSFHFVVGDNIKGSARVNTSPQSIYNREFDLLPVSSPTNTIFEFFDFLDSISDHIQNALKIIMLRHIENNDPEMFIHYSHYNLPEMEKYYDKYFDHQ